MQTGARFRADLSFAGLTVGTLLLFMYASWCGLLLTHDSYQYLAAAANFRESRIWVGLGGQPFVYWTPLFPILLAPWSHPTAMVLIFHAVLLAILSWQMHVLIYQQVASRLIRLLVLVFILWGVHVTLISVFVWSELLFLVLLIAMAQVLQFQKGKHYIWWAAGIGFLLCLQRNAGLFFVAGASGWLFFHVKDSPAKRLLTAVLFFSIAASGLAGWHVYNAIRLGDQFPIASHAYFLHIPHNAIVIGQGFARAFMPFDFPLIAIGVSILLFAFLIYQATKDDALLLWLLLGYVLGMVCLFELDPVDADRYVAVVLWIVALLVSRPLARAQTHFSGKWTAVLLSAILLLYPLARTVRNVVQWHQMSCAAAPGPDSFSR